MYDSGLPRVSAENYISNDLASARFASAPALHLDLGELEAESLLVGDDDVGPEVKAGHDESK